MLRISNSLTVGRPIPLAMRSGYSGIALSGLINNINTNEYSTFIPEADGLGFTGQNTTGAAVAGWALASFPAAGQTVRVTGTVTGTGATVSPSIQLRQTLGSVTMASTTNEVLTTDGPFTVDLVALAGAESLTVSEGNVNANTFTIRITGVIYI